MTYKTGLHGTVLSINVTALVHEGKWTGSEGRTGIDKRSVEGAIEFSNESVAGDVIVDRKHHGGYHQAVYAYALEDAKWWEQKLGISLAYGKFGENLTTSGIDVSGATIGERWKIGSVVLEVSEPRIPCRVFAGFWERPTLIQEFMNENRSGSYLRIIEEGMASSGDKIEIIFRPDHGVTITDLFAARRGDRGRISEINAVPQLSQSWRDWSDRILSD
jgi:MOSC domain-containing protein YiiM